MPITVVVGLQWGDEGKGRIVDLEAKKADVVARYNGGPNAGHTVVSSVYGKIVLHHVPAGIIHENVDWNVIAGAMVVNPKILLDEFNGLHKLGVEFDRRLMIDQRCFMIFPWHQDLDGLLERVKGSGKTGTTKQGMGPVYADHSLYIGVPIGYLRRPQELKLAMEQNLTVHRAFLKGIDPTAGEYDLEAVWKEYLGYGERLIRFIGNTQKLVYNLWKKGARILGESGQGFWIGSLMAPPRYRSASSNTAAAMCHNLGIPAFPERVVGTFKITFVTRVGNGPFPTKMFGQFESVANQVRRDGNEFGATSGRPRDVGWFDLPMLKPAIRVNGCTELAAIKIDIRPSGKEIVFCDRYVLGQHIVDDALDLEGDDWFRIQPSYVSRPAWDQDISGITTWEGLPDAAREYILYVEQNLGVPIKIISTGPETDQMVRR